MNTGKLRGKINERVQRSEKKQPGIQMPAVYSVQGSYCPISFRSIASNAPEKMMLRSSTEASMSTFILTQRKFHDIAEKGAAKKLVIIFLVSSVISMAAVFSPIRS